jgi:hypothetical protein
MAMVMEKETRWWLLGRFYHFLDCPAQRISKGGPILNGGLWAWPHAPDNSQSKGFTSSNFTEIYCKRKQNRPPALALSVRTVAKITPELCIHTPLKPERVT